MRKKEFSPKGPFQLLGLGLAIHVFLQSFGSACTALLLGKPELFALTCSKL